MRGLAGRPRGHPVPEASRKFSLKPFPGEERGPAREIRGALSRSADSLSLDCAIRGDLGRLAIPAPAARPGRKGRLWEETCLEMFLGTKDSEGYWEFNLSPAGHWNVYRFSSYRRGMREETAFPSLPFRVLPERGALRVCLGLSLGTILPGGKDVAVGVCAVVRTAHGTASHWAMAHPGDRPDFHRREGFALLLPAE